MSWSNDPQANRFFYFVMVACTTFFIFSFVGVLMVHLVLHQPLIPLFQGGLVEDVTGGIVGLFSLWVAWNLAKKNYPSTTGYKPNPTAETNR